MDIGKYVFSSLTVPHLAHIQCSGLQWYGSNKSQNFWMFQEKHPCIDVDQRFSTAAGLSCERVAED